MSGGQQPSPPTKQLRTRAMVKYAAKLEKMHAKHTQIRNLKAQMIK